MLFAGEALVNQREAYADAQNSGYTFAGEAVTKAFEQIAGARQDAISSTNAARRDALAYGGEAMEAGYQFSGEATSRAFNSVDDAMEALERGQNAGYAFAGEATGSAFQAIGSDREDTFTFLGEAFQSAMDHTTATSDQLQEMARQTTSNIMSNSEYAMDQVAKANESENLETMRMIVLAGVATVGFIAWSASK